MCLRKDEANEKVFLKLSEMEEMLINNKPLSTQGFVFFINVLSILA